MILIRADGNSILGTGHIMRCLAIADEVKKRGTECVFVTADTEPYPLLNSKGFKVEVLETSYQRPLEELDTLKQIFLKYRPSAILVDSYFVNYEYFVLLRRISESDCKLIYIDDMQKDLYECDMIIYYGVDGENCSDAYHMRYEKAGLLCPELLLGPSYVPLREEFKGVKQWELKEEVKDILILTGGSDVSHTGKEILKHLKKQNKYGAIQFHFVVGKLNRDLEEIKKIASHLENIVIHTNVKKMRDLMSQADIAISAGGTTLFELCACGIPMIIYTCADNQINGVKNMVKKIGAKYIGDARNNPDMINELFGAVDVLCKDISIRQEISNKEQALVDGLGTHRIIKHILDDVAVCSR